MSEETQAQAVVLWFSNALRVLSVRALSFLSLMATLGLFIAAICIGSLISLFTAGAFALFVFLPILIHDHKVTGVSNG